MAMIRKANYTFIRNEAMNKRTASSQERIAVESDKLYVTCDALHWEQAKPATQKEKVLYGVDHAYAGNDNGDFFEGARNVVWACRNPKCTNRNDHQWKQGIFRFLKYEGKETCPHCESEDIYDWEKDTFQTNGELLAKNQDGRFRYETWKDEPVNINHDDKRIIGKIADVWPEPPKKAVVELLELDRKGKFGNERLCLKVEQGIVDSGSMELLTGIGMCSITFKVHTTEAEFSDKLKKYKGRIDPESGLHCFEICKSITGCGHAIIETGEPADSGATVRQVLASKQPTSGETSFNPTMSTEGKPQFEKHATKRVAKPVTRAEGAGASVPAETPPDFSHMGDQLKVFGNFDSTRSPEELRMAKMTPTERAEYLEFQSFKRAKAEGRSSAVSVTPTLRVDKEFVAGVARQLAATGKISAQTVVDSITDMSDESNRADIRSALAVRKNKSDAIAKLAVRKAQISTIDVAQETILDAIADALIEAGEAMKQQVSDVTYEDIDSSFVGLTESPEKQNDLLDFLTESDKKSEEVAPENETTGETASEEPAAESSEENNDMSKKSAQAIEAAPAARNPKTQLTPGTEQASADSTKAPGKNLPETTSQDSVAPEKTPGSELDSTLVVALKARLASINAKIASGEGDFDSLVREAKKVEAQIRSPKTETTPGSDEGSNALGGGIVENPKAVISSPSQKAIKSETTPGSDEGSENLGGGIVENPKPVLHVAKLEEAMKIAKKIEAGDTKGVSAADIAMLKEMGILPKDAKIAQAQDALKPEHVKGEGEKIESEEFPESKADVQVEKAPAARDPKLETTPGSAEGQLESRTAQKEGLLVDLKKDEEAKGQGVATKPGAADSVQLEGANLESPTKVGEAEKVMADAVNNSETTKAGEADKAQLEGANNSDVTKPGEACATACEGKNNDEPTKSEDRYPDSDILKTAKLEASFERKAGKGMASQSHWTVFANNEPVYRVTLAQAFPGEVIENAPVFASEEYSEKLVAHIRQAGLKDLHENVFGGAGKLFTASERKAQSQMPATVNPTAPQQPMNVDPAVADKIMSDAKPGISVVDLLANLAAPIVAESDTLSVAGFVEELVNSAQDQEKVSLLTNKLNERVNELKQSSGAPVDQAAPATPGAAPSPAPTSTPATIQAMKTELDAANKRYSALLAAQRIMPLVREAQEVGLLDNYTTLHAGGMSRAAAKKQAQDVLDGEVKRVIALSDEAYLEYDRATRSAIKQARLAKDVKAVKKAANWNKMQEEAGGAILGTLHTSSAATEKDSLDLPGKSRLSSFRFSTANSVSKDGMDAAMKARENRNPRE